RAAEWPGAPARGDRFEAQQAEGWRIAKVARHNRGSSAAAPWSLAAGAIEPAPPAAAAVSTRRACLQPCESRPPPCGHPPGRIPPSDGVHGSCRELRRPELME